MVNLCGPAQKQCEEENNYSRWCLLSRFMREFWQGVLSLELTPKALANFSPGFELVRTLGHQLKYRTNAESVCLKDEPLQGLTTLIYITQGSRKLEPWAEISERLRRIRT